MKLGTGVLLIILFFGLDACSGGTFSNQREADGDIAELITIVGQATALAEGVAEGSVLRQVDLGRDPVRWGIRFTDAAATQEITVVVPLKDVPSDGWEVRTGISPLIGHQSSGLFLDGLRVGPAAVIEAATKHWNGCPVHGLTLTGKERQLVWYIFCNLPQGVVSGTMDGVTGGFVPSLAPPAQLPPTATPDCKRYRSAQGC